MLRYYRVSGSYASALVRASSEERVQEICEDSPWVGLSYGVTIEEILDELPEGEVIIHAYAE